MAYEALDRPGGFSRLNLLVPLRHRNFRLLWAGMTVSLLGDGIFLVALAWQAYQLWNSPAAFVWVMIGLTLVGLLFTWWARLHLGRLWSSSVTRKADHRVIDTGPYGIVRHPIYTGIILGSLATAAMRGTALAWLGALVMTIGWVIKARLEELLN